MKYTRTKKIRVNAQTGMPIKSGQIATWKPEMAEIVYRLALLGCDDSQCAAFLQVREEVIAHWKRTNLEFRNSYLKGKQETDMNVVGALYKRALGYKYTETTTYFDNKGKIRKTEVTTKEVAGDVHAQLTWLARRQREIWGDNKVDVNINFNKVDVRYVNEHLKDKELYSTEDLEAALDVALFKVQKSLAQDGVEEV